MTRTTLTGAPTHSQVGRNGSGPDSCSPERNAFTAPISPRLSAAHAPEPDRPDHDGQGPRPMSRLLTRPQVERRTGLARSTLYRMMRSNRFPLPVRVGRRAVRWPESEIEHWIATRPRSNGFDIR